MSNDRDYGAGLPRVYQGVRGSRGGFVTPQMYADWAKGGQTNPPYLGKPIDDETLRKASAAIRNRESRLEKVHTEEDMREFLAWEWDQWEEDRGRPALEEGLDEYGEPSEKRQEKRNDRIDRLVGYSDEILSHSSHPGVIEGIARKTVIESYLMARDYAQEIRDVEDTLQMVFLDL